MVDFRITVDVGGVSNPDYSVHSSFVAQIA